MSQLHLFLNTLKEPEKKKLGNLNLRGKEKETLDYTIRFLQKEFPDSDRVTLDLGVTKTHMYKINSVLLSKCYALLFPDDIFTLLEYLKQNGLYVLMRTEARAAEKMFAEIIDDKGREEFYLRLFHLFIDVPYKYFDKKAVEEYGDKYVKAIKNPGVSDELYVEHHKLFADCNRFAALKNPQKAFGVTEKDLLDKEKKLEGTKHYLAQYYLFRTFISYYSFYLKEPGKIKPYFKKCLALKEKIQHFFPIDIGQFLNLMYADRLFADQETEEAYTLFKNEYDKGVSEKMYGYHYHCEQYILLCILKKDWTTAEELLKKVFEPLIQQKADILATRGCLAYIKFYLCREEYKLAMQYIHAGSDINEKTTYL
ncbi:MAG TPA: hypothetical protein VGF30_13080, partial [Bacteroidia bacterium]